MLNTKFFWLALNFCACAVFTGPARAEKLMLAHVAINPAQSMLLLAKDSGMLAKYGFTAEVVLIPGTPRTVQALIAGDLDYVVAGAPASIRARAQGADVVVLSALSNFSSQRVFVKSDSTLGGIKELKGKIIGVTQYGSGGDTFLRAALRKTGINESEVTILQMGGTPGVATRGVRDEARGRAVLRGDGRGARLRHEDDRQRAAAREAQDHRAPEDARSPRLGRESRRWDSNPRHPLYKSGALPAELLRRASEWYGLAAVCAEQQPLAANLTLLRR